MTERKYSVSEIDRMRDALDRREQPYVPYWHRPTSGYQVTFLPPNYEQLDQMGFAHRQERIELILRTYMAAGVEPEEVEATAEIPKGYSPVSWAMHQAGIPVGVGETQEEADRT